MCVCQLCLYCDRNAVLVNYSVYMPVFQIKDKKGKTKCKKMLLVVPNRLRKVYAEKCMKKIVPLLKKQTPKQSA